jgi:hypothetical protein
MDGIVNRVAESGLITIDLEEFYPQAGVTVFDISRHLHQGLLLREKDFREFIKTHDWSAYKGAVVAVTCSTDAIVPTWAYMLLALSLSPVAEGVYLAEPEKALEFYYLEKILAIDPAAYSDARVVIKGCSNKPVPASAYVALTARLRPAVKSVMYGEPCSTVPLYKAARKNP